MVVDGETFWLQVVPVPVKVPPPLLSVIDHEPPFVTVPLMAVVPPVQIVVAALVMAAVGIFTVTVEVAPPDWVHAGPVTLTQ